MLCLIKEDMVVVNTHPRVKNKSLVRFRASAFLFVSTCALLLMMLSINHPGSVSKRAPLPMTLTDTYSDLMMKKEIQRSFRHQQKFLANKSTFTSVFPREARYTMDLGEFAAIDVTDKFAYLHIWKSGGSTVLIQTDYYEPQKSLLHPAVKDKDFFTFVRDPIDHFLSGWAEAAVRQFETDKNQNESLELQVLDKASYDKTIKAFVKEMNSLTYGVSKIEMIDQSHAFPQANFMVDDNGEIDPRIKVVGDMHEMLKVLEVIGFNDTNKHEEKGRDASMDEMKQKYFPARKDWLSDETLIEICDFVAVDYYLFDFVSPEACLLRTA